MPKATGASVDVSLCIVNWNTADLVAKLLDSAYAFIKGVTFETIVVDNASNDGSAERVTREYPQTVLVRNNTNAGYGAAMNQGLRLARGRYMLVLNSDVILRPDAVERMVQFLDQHPEAGVVGGMCLDADERPGWSYGMFPRPGRLFLDWVFGSRLPRKFRPPELAYIPSTTATSPFEVEYIIGACMLVRREVVEHVGLLDERFFAFFEETDWCLRIRQRGWKIYLLPEVRVIHLGSASFDQVPEEKMRRWHESFYIYLRKHHGAFVASALKLAAIWKEHKPHLCA